ncbi:conjugal transfer protein TraA, partial [Salmonella enterica]|nr:conjugal transfer protein TraA [Salmonella enterica]
MSAVLGVQDTSVSVNKKSFFSKFTRLGLLNIVRAAIPAAVLLFFFPQLAMAGGGATDLMASGNTTVKATFGKDSSAVKWVILA